MRVTRDIQGNMEVFLDGNVEPRIRVQDSSVSSSEMFYLWLEGRNSGNRVFWDDIRVGEPAAEGEILSVPLSPSNDTLGHLTLEGMGNVSVDVVDADNVSRVLLPNVSNGDSLESIPLVNRLGVRLRGRLSRLGGLGEPRLGGWGAGSLVRDTLGDLGLVASSANLTLGEGVSLGGGGLAVLDDFSDLDFNAGPVWEVVSGSHWSASGGSLSGDERGTHVIRTGSVQGVGEWSWDIRFDSLPAVVAVSATFFMGSAERDPVDPFFPRDGYFVHMTTQGRLELFGRVSGGHSILKAASWVPDTDVHHVRVTRDALGNLEVFLDGDVVPRIRVQDNSVSSSEMFYLWLEGRGSDNRVSWDNLSVPGLALEGELVSVPFRVSRPVTRLTPVWRSTEPNNTTVTFNVSVDNGSTWSPAVNGVPVEFPAGGSGPSGLRYRATLRSMDGVSTPVLREVRLAYGGAMSLPSNVSVDLGGDNVTEVFLEGELNSTTLSRDFRAEMSPLVPACSCTGCQLSGQVCAVPVVVRSETPGRVELSNLSLQYILSDATLDAGDISFSTASANPGNNVTITANVRNEGAVDLSDVRVQFLNGSESLGYQTIPVLPSAEGRSLFVVLENVTRGSHNITVVVDPLNGTAEFNESNNVAVRVLNVSEEANFSNVSLGVGVAVRSPTPVTVSIENTMDPNVSTFNVSTGGLLSFRVVNVTASGPFEWMYITIAYNETEVAEAGVNESTLRLYFWNGTAWVVAENSGVDTENNTVFANVSHLTIFAPIGVVMTVPANVDLDPDTLNLKSKGEWVTAHIEVPGRDMARLRVETVRLLGPGGVVWAENDTRYGFVRSLEVGDRDGDGLLEAMVKFSRSEVGR
ncbi:MAG: hypothetical protein HY558_02275, partial [Euryarchaeota archaeon]|nr:hypothetical protein [Euryarchaeota archaeon]